MTYPINLDINDKICVVLGGGKVAFRKVNGLLKAGGKVILIAPEICDELKNLVNDQKITWRCESYSVGCLPNGLIFIAATNDPKINELAMIEASEKNFLINNVNSNYQLPITNYKLFTVPAIVRRENLMLTISTDGLSPALSKLIREQLEKIFNENFAEFLKFLSEIRDEVKNKIADVNEREQFWRNVMSNENFSLVQQGEINKAEVNIQNALNSYRSKSQNSIH
ncbi:MAG: bifunctional precorrin-2 dehydrogenase/sirohydrochlorin ferrochelatase [Selenomonadaceae bacterium]|nr:bifunctional precorrin-2 dehydrogenase/sirohydrochlorin ferrochelatase [Selenomonadaceae bacterium]